MNPQRPRREYPSHADYDMAVQNIRTFVSDLILKTGTPTLRRDGGGPLSYPGGFAKAYKVNSGGKNYALRVWLNDIGDAAHHYAAVRDFFKQHPLPCFVGDFDFIPNGILVNGQRYPILRMEWVEGQTLGDFITSNLRKTKILGEAASAFLELVRTLHGKQVAHGDLQSENMIVGCSGPLVWYKLIDYDTLVVPALVGRSISSIGLQCYQHPRRADSPAATAQDDYFAELVIYLCLLALVEAPDLWSKFPPVREKELLFLPGDFAAPAPTQVFLRLHQMGGMVRWLAVALWNFTRQPAIDRLLPLKTVIDLAREALKETNFERLLKGKMSGAQAGSVPLRERLLDNAAFLLSPPIPSAPVKPAVPGTLPGLAGSPAPGGESFAQMQGRLNLAGPSPAPVATLPRAPLHKRRVWTWAAAVAVAVKVLALAWWKPLAPTPTPEVRGGLPIELVKIDSGTFVMGSPAQEADREGDEGPQMRVTISRGFSMGKYEVTQGQYEAVMGSNPSGIKGSTNLPVENVSWEDATNFCAKLTERERQAGRLSAGQVYRLPTEAEWEYACRAGTTDRFSFGDDLELSELGKYGWYNENSGQKTHLVGEKAANPWGLHDMHGNVWEWCQDWKDTYPGGSVTDPQGRALGSNRVMRGGSWNNYGRYCRSANRGISPPGIRYDNNGFRAVLAPGQA